GPAGAFLLSRPDFGQRFDVRALTVRPDGTMGSGRATPLSTGRDPVFGELAQDPSGRLHAVWQERDPAAAGVRLRTGTAGGAGGPSFGPEQTLVPGADAGQFSIAAAADGGGFVALNRTGGVNSPGQIQAVGFGTLRATNAPGLGGLEGGSGGGA